MTKKYTICLLFTIFIGVTNLTGCKSSSPFNYPPEHFYRLGLMYFQSGKYQRAEVTFKTALDLRPTYAEAYTGLAYTYYWMAQIAYQKKDIPRTKKCYNWALYNFDNALKYKDYGHPYLGKGMVFLQGWNAYDLAIENFLKAIESEPESMAVRIKADFYLGNCYTLAGKHQKAIEAYTEYLELYSDNPDRKEIEDLIKELQKRINKER